MSEVSAKDQIKLLIELQKLDKEIFEYKRELKERPAEIELARQGYEAKKGRLNELEEELKLKQVKRKDQEVDLQAKEEEILKFNAQLSQLKTNKEYKAKLTEIESLGADKSMIEEKILILFDEFDIAKSEIEKEKGVLAEEEKKYLAQKKEVEDLVKQLKDKVEVLEGQRKQIAVNVTPAYISRYERILNNKEGLAIVCVENGSCTGCYMNVPVQRINEIKKYDDLVYCEMCARILYTEEIF